MRAGAEKSKVGTKLEEDPINNNKLTTQKHRIKCATSLQSLHVYKQKTHFHWSQRKRQRKPSAGAQGTNMLSAKGFTVPGSKPQMDSTSAMRQRGFPHDVFFFNCNGRTLTKTNRSSTPNKKPVRPVGVQIALSSTSGTSKLRIDLDINFRNTSGQIGYEILGLPGSGSTTRINDRSSCTNKNHPLQGLKSTPKTQRLKEKHLYNCITMGSKTGIPKKKSVW